MTYTVLIPYLNSPDLVQLYGVSRLTKSMLTPKDSRCIRFDVLFRMQSKWRVTNEVAKLLYAAKRFECVLKIVKNEHPIYTFPLPDRDIDYRGVTDWTEGPLRQWLDKLAALELPTGQEEIEYSTGQRVKASGNMLENRLVGKCTFKNWRGDPCEGVAYKG